MCKDWITVIITIYIEVYRWRLHLEVYRCWPRGIGDEEAADSSSHSLGARQALSIQGKEVEHGTRGTCSALKNPLQ